MKHKTIQASGKVIHGERLGKGLGFPTANLDRRDYSRRKLKIRLGVWAGWAEIAKNEKRKTKNIIPFQSFAPCRGGKLWKAGIVIGPFDNHKLPKIEAHLIGFKGNLYGRMLLIYLVKYLRPFRKFKSEKELKAQIKKDILLIKNIKFQIPNK